MNIKIKSGLYGVALGLVLSSPFLFYFFFESIVVRNPLLFALSGVSYHFTLPFFSFFLGVVASPWIILFNIIFYYIFGFVFISFYLKNRNSNKYINYILFALIAVLVLFAVYNFSNYYDSRVKQENFSSISRACITRYPPHRPDFYGVDGVCFKKENEQWCKQEKIVQRSSFLRCLNDAGYKNEIGEKI